MENTKTDRDMRTTKDIVANAARSSMSPNEAIDDLVARIEASDGEFSTLGNLCRNAQECAATIMGRGGRRGEISRVEARYLMSAAQRCLDTLHLIDSGAAQTAESAR